MTTWREASTSPTAILTYSGRVFDFQWPVTQMARAIDILDVAHALARLCRYTGHTSYHCSVADHSMRVAHVVRGTGGGALQGLQALLHDAAEAYVGDVSGPLKTALGGRQGPLYAIEHRVQLAVWQALEVPPPTEEAWARIHRADLASRDEGLERFQSWRAESNSEGRFLEMYAMLKEAVANGDGQ